eukprot:scaffold162111_cov16-Tisochrysis_lutea.AAC.2
MGTMIVLFRGKQGLGPSAEFLEGAGWVQFFMACMCPLPMTAIVPTCCCLQAGMSPLFVASYMGRSDIVKELIDHGASIDQQNKVGSCIWKRPMGCQKKGGPSAAPSLTSA